MPRRRRTTTAETAETRAEVEAAQHRHAHEQAIGALSALTPNVA
jgi:hypothetical protein